MEKQGIIRTVMHVMDFFVRGINIFITGWAPHAAASNVDSIQTVLLLNFQLWAGQPVQNV